MPGLDEAVEIWTRRLTDGGSLDEAVHELLPVEWRARAALSDAEAELVGPFTREFECTLGLPCAVVVSGYRLASTSAIVAIHSPDVAEWQLDAAPAPPQFSRCRHRRRIYTGQSTSHRPFP